MFVELLCLIDHLGLNIYLFCFSGKHSVAHCQPGRAGGGRQNSGRSFCQRERAEPEWFYPAVYGRSGES